MAHARLRGRRRGRRARRRAVPGARRAARRHGPADALPGDVPARRTELPPGRGRPHDLRRPRRPRTRRPILERLEALDRADARSSQLRVLGGAMARVPADATAFAHRERRIMVNVARSTTDPEELPAHEAWVDRARRAARAAATRPRTSTSWATRARSASARPTRARRGTGWRRSRPLRPGQPLPAQPERPAGGGLGGARGARPARPRSPATASAVRCPVAHSLAARRGATTGTPPDLEPRRTTASRRRRSRGRRGPAPAQADSPGGPGAHDFRPRDHGVDEARSSRRPPTTRCSLRSRRRPPRHSTAIRPR